MKEAIEDIRAKLLNGKYDNEEQIRLSLAARILSEADWDLWNPEEVYPDFQVESSGKPHVVDLALFAESSSPAVCIEISPPGEPETKSEEFVNSLGDYVIDDAAVMVVHTDGRQWKFYFAGTAESFADRCFKSLDMLEDPVDNLESAFAAYLSKAKVSDGSALRDARDYLWLSSAVQAVTEVLGEARKLVTEPPYPRLPQVVVQLVTDRGLEIEENEVIKILENIETQKKTDVPPEMTEGSEPSTDSGAEPEVSEEPESPPEAETAPPSEAASEKEPSPEDKTPPEEEPSPVPESQPEAPDAGKKPAKDIKLQNFLNKQIKGFTFLDNSYSPKSWKEMLTTFCLIVCSMHTDDFYKCLKLRINNRLCFSKNIKDFFGLSPVQIGDTDFYLMTDLNSNEIVELVYKIIELFNYDKIDMEINAG